MVRHPLFLLKAGAWIVLNGILWAVLYHTLRSWMTSHGFTAALLAGAISGTIALPPLLEAAFPRSPVDRLPSGEPLAAGETSPHIPGELPLLPADSEPSGSWATDMPLFAFFGMVPAGFFYSSLRHIQPGLLTGGPLEILVVTATLFSLVVVALGCICYLLPGSASAEP